MIIQPLIPANGAAVDGDVVGAEVVLVRLAPAQEIEPALPLVDRLLQRQRLGEQADGEGGGGRGGAAVVEEGLPILVEAEDAGGADTAEGEEDELQPSLRHQGGDDRPEEPLHLLRHERGLVRAAYPVRAQEIVQGALDGDRLADSLQDYGTALGELAQLAAQLVPVLPVKRRQVLVPGRGQLQLRADVLSLDAYAQAEAGRRRLERAQGRRAFGHRPQHQLLPGLLAKAAEHSRDDRLLFAGGGDEVHIDRKSTSL